MKTVNPILKKIILDIENSAARIIERKPENTSFKLRQDAFLLSNLSGWAGALLVRAILHQLNIDEFHVFKWRLENKCIQYLVINHYLPGYMPRTFSLSEVLNSPNGVSKIGELLKRGYFIKATLGDGSARTQNFDRTAELDTILNQHDDKSYDNEEWILQKKLNLIEEFRVHTFNKDIIYGLTFKTQGTGLSKINDAEEFVKRVLDKLPDTILQGSLIGWDIGLNIHYKYYIIEANFTGFHPKYRAGFQTTGHVDDDMFGPIVCAWLNNYFDNKYDISIATVENSLLSTVPFFKAFMFYSTLLKKEHLEIFHNVAKKSVTAILYLDEYTNNNLITLIHYLQRVNFSRKYYIITREQSYSMVSALFGIYDHLHVLSENKLFTENQFQLIKQLGDDRRKQAACYHALRTIKEESYVII